MVMLNCAKADDNQNTSSVGQTVFVKIFHFGATNNGSEVDWIGKRLLASPHSLSYAPSEQSLQSTLRRMHCRSVYLAITSASCVARAQDPKHCGTMKSVFLCSALFLLGAAEQHWGPWQFGNRPGNETTEQLFSRMDVNKDNAVVPNEFLRWSADVVGLAEKEFDDRDKNKDKKLTLEEMRAFKKEVFEREEKIAEKAYIQHAEDLIKPIDKNNDNVLDMDELTNYFELRRLKTDNLKEILKPFDTNGDWKFDVKELAGMRYCFF
uniref:EF hand n=1 Tax=Steinernema glaseri TaxID=37863 RepID=A0A1I7ZPJ6_9BILA